MKALKEHVKEAAKFFIITDSKLDQLIIPRNTLANEPKEIKGNLIIGTTFLLADNSNRILAYNDLAKLNDLLTGFI